MHWPNGIKSQSAWYRYPAQLIDVIPTLLDVCGVKYPETYLGHELFPLRGVSLVPSFTGESLRRSEPLFSEHENNAFMIDGPWKLVGKGVAAQQGPDLGKWELYNLNEDRTETKNLAQEEHQRLRAMADEWHAWSLEDKVYPKPSSKRRK